ncbi:MAG: efflux RND transporter permease subunit [Gammaproteobacteria bacterium]|nr:efflux RND transporter permease subunit [Gammaproteobacteria bacterium]
MVSDGHDDSDEGLQNQQLSVTKEQSNLPVDTADSDSTTYLVRPSEGIIGWFARNHVAANLLMIAILGAGVYMLFTGMQKETMPTWSFGQISIYVPFRGASPEEVEEGILYKVEEAVRSVEGVGNVASEAYEGAGRVFVEVVSSYEIDAVIDEVKLVVDSISNLPSDSERPIIREREGFRSGALYVQIYGELDFFTLQDIAADIRNEILELSEVSQASIQGARSSEISIEIPEENLRKYELTLSQVAQLIRLWSVDLAGGGIRTEGGYVRVRATGQANTAEDYEDIVLLTRPDGSVLKLRDIGTVVDNYSETDFWSFFNGQPTIGISVDARDGEDVLAISKAVREYVDQRKQTLPPSVQLDYFGDSTHYLNDRLNMMLKNIMFGAILVFILLGLFLHLRIAFWVCVGLPVAFMGALFVLPLVGVTLNLVSLFGFILVIGVVVDDAIIIAESAYAETERRGYNVDSIIRGARRVAVPATFGVLTTVAAFTPMLFAQGGVTVFFQSIGWVVIMCLLFSLVESKLILPSHMALMQSSRGKRRGVADYTNHLLKRFSKDVYIPSLRLLLRNRYATMCAFLALLLLTVGFYLSPFLKKSFFPEFENDFVFVNVAIMEGLSDEYIVNVTESIMTAMHATNDEIVAETGAREKPIQHVFAFIADDTSARLTAELAKPENRTLRPTDIASRWRAKVGNIAGTTELQFSAEQRFHSGAPLEFDLTGKNFDALDAAAEELAQKLAEYDGVYEIRTPIGTGPDEIKLEVKPDGKATGLTLSSLAMQVREAFFGIEAQRIQRGESEYRVIVRYPETERTSIGNLENMWVRLPDGTSTLFHSVADYSIEPGYGTIRRINGKRTVSVSAEVDRAKIDPFVVYQDLQEHFFPFLKTRFPSVDIQEAGSVQDQMLALEELGVAFLVALLSIYVLLAIPLRSYLQPLIIMSVIPFGFIGAVVGHVILNVSFNMVSMIGCIALTGVVVNDSLILVHYFNRERRTENRSVLHAILRAGKARLRAIILTSLTTFFGLVPILLEPSLQAKIVANMAISLAFGILFATLITLVLVPVLLRIGADLARVKDADLVLDEDRSREVSTVAAPAGG